MSRVLALVDCNNFFAECERLFRPDLKDRPLIVLSNNDGCVIARSQEAKKLGIKMGTPFFQIKNYVKNQGISVFSCNHCLYADLSARIFSILEALTPNVEIYSIDEAFIDLSGLSGEISLTTLAHQLRAQILRWVGLPVSIGIGPNKTLAKLASVIAKQAQNVQQVMDLRAPAERQYWLKKIPVQTIWGIGKSHSTELARRHIYSAEELAKANYLNQHACLPLRRTQKELQGELCISWHDSAPEKKQLIYSRSFATKIYSLKVMSKNICIFTTKVSEKLRYHKKSAGIICVFLKTCPFINKKSYTNCATAHFPTRVFDSKVLIAKAKILLKQIWRPDLAYAKAGIMLADLAPTYYEQGDLFNAKKNEQRLNYLTAIDKWNRSNKTKIFVASAYAQNKIIQKKTHESPHYTTRWKDIAPVS